MAHKTIAECKEEIAKQKKEIEGLTDVINGQSITICATRIENERFLRWLNALIMAL